jgi:uroporphyrinogen decarboxylase
VAETTRQLMDLLGRGGGYIVAPSHVLQSDVPTENVLALYDSAYEYDAIGIERRTA